MSVVYGKVTFQSSGNPAPNYTVSIGSTPTQTDGNGQYQLQVAAGVKVCQVKDPNNNVKHNHNLLVPSVPYRHDIALA